MGMTFRFTPPKINAAVAVHAAVEAAEQLVADEVLDTSRPLVPVDQNVLAASGRTVRTDRGVAVTYGKDDDGTKKHAPSNQYAVIQHEHLELHHPNGGQAKFLEQPLNQAQELAPIAAAALRKAFGTP